MQEVIIMTMNKFGYIGILLLIALENIFPPIPSEVILTFGGFMTTYTKLKIGWVIIFATVGSLIGTTILYYLGRILNKERIIKLISGKVGKILRVKKDDIEKADNWFRKKGTKTVLFCRFIPIVRSLISIPAGMSKMPITKFLIFTAIGTMIWNIFLVVAGSIVGENWLSVVNIFEKYSLIVLVIIALAFLTLIYLYYKKTNLKK